MKARREFLKTAGLFLVAAACRPDNLFGPIKKKPKFAAWSSTFKSSTIPLQVSALDVRQDRQYADSVATPGLLAFARDNPGQIYIHGDEPDQSGILPEDYAVIYHDWSAALRAVDPKCRLSPAGFAEPNNVPGPHSTEYAGQFVGAYKTIFGKEPTVDEWRFHDFGLDRQGDLDAWWRRVQSSAQWSVDHGAPMVLGSWGFLDWDEPEELFLDQLRAAKSLIESESRISQAVWWSYSNTGYPHFLANADGTLTAEGRVYAEVAA